MSPAERSPDLLVPCILSALAGAAAFLVVLGPRLLDPENVAWLMVSGNVATSYLGWWFFRSAPAALPPGLNPAYGMEIGSSVYFSDSIPLLALLLKPLAGAWPSPFQYHGLWALGCFVLQGTFACLLSRALGTDRKVAVLMAALSCFAPTFLARLGGQPSLTDHFALGAQWLILAALWLNFREPRNPTWWWPALLAVAAVVHSYLLAMVLALWVAARWGAGRVPAAGAERLGDLQERLLAYAGIGLGLWMAGFFEVSAFHGLKGDGYGEFRMNVAALIDSNGWSRWLPDVPGNDGDHEGFAYLGLGPLMFVAVAAAGIVRRPLEVEALRRRAPLLVMLFGLTAFAVTHRVGVGGEEVLRLPVPTWFESLATTLRSSGRLAWPLVYAIPFMAVWAISRAFGRSVALACVAAALIVQVIDLQPGWQSIRERWDAATSGAWRSRLSSPAWSVLAQRYRAIWVLPPQNHPPGWRDIAWLAAEHRLATNAVDVARFDVRGLQRAQRHAAEVLAGRNVDRSRLYVLDPPSAAVIADHLADDDLLLRLDGLVVFAPGGADLKVRLGL